MRKNIVKLHNIVCMCCCLILFFVKNYEKEGQNCRAQKLVDSTVLHGSAVAIIVG